MKKHWNILFLVGILLGGLLTGCDKGIITINLAKDSSQEKIEKPSKKALSEESTDEDKESQKIAESPDEDNEIQIRFDESTEKGVTGNDNTTIPSNIVNSMKKMHQVLENSASILNEMATKDPTNVFDNKDITTLRNNFLDQYTTSGDDYKALSIYRYYDKKDAGNKIKDEIYTYGTIFQEAMYEANVSFYQMLYMKGDTTGFKKQKAAFELRFNKASEIYNKIQSITTSGPASDYSNIPLTAELSPVLLLDYLWVTHQKIWRMHGEYFEDTNFSKLPIDDALEQIDPIIGDSKIAMEYLKTFSRQYDMERQDDWNLEEANGVMDSWYTSVNYHLYAIQIYSNKNKLEDYYGGKSYIPTDDMIKYSIQYQMQMLNYKQFNWQYTRARDFLRSDNNN
ncbi:hypothetical protein [Neobacillus sp. YIM B06451]|uniref:hypothetical protein n=1 Tax=Neobacillus sp. YIM B06451 TaxID=3070994 RepID=UPI002930BA96|nr:hypothetical protein [Neobacillus sp. YIM B06451]